MITFMALNLLALNPFAPDKPERLRDLIKTVEEVSPDVVAIQEVKVPDPAGAGFALEHLGGLFGGLTCITAPGQLRQPPQYALAHGPVLAVGVLWNPRRLRPVPGTLRTLGDLQYAQTDLTGDADLTVASHHATWAMLDLRVDQARHVAGHALRAHRPYVLGADTNCIGSARKPDGEFYDSDPYADADWSPHFEFQCIVDPDANTWQADRRPALAMERAGLIDAAPASGEEWKATDGHWPTCDFGVLGINRRLMRIHLDSRAGAMLESYTVIETPHSVAATDHLPPVVKLATP